MNDRKPRRKPPPPGEFAADVVDLAQDGRGIAKVDGKVTFVTGALPGERVRFRYTRMHRDTDEGEVIAVDVPSRDRVTPPCRHFGLCGGCALQHLAPEAQVRFKEKQLLDALARVGKVEPAEVAPPIIGPTTGYRRRARLGVKYVEKKGTALVGFRERESPFLAALETCDVLDPRVGAKLRALGECVASLSIRNQVPQIEVACAAPPIPGAGAVALVIRTLAPPQEADRAKLSAFAREHDFHLYLQSGGPDSIVPMTPPAPLLDYSPDGGPDRLHFQPTDFIQINEGVAQQAVRQALDWLGVTPGLRVLELFCGLGNFSVPLARAGARVTAVEGEAGLVARARENAENLGLSIAFHRADLFAPQADAPWLAEKFDALLLDPPRVGAEAILPVVAKKKPRRIVYVSCHPGTLARDAGTLVHGARYRLVRAGVLDMFPHTAHVESMALFERD